MAVEHMVHFGRLKKAENLWRMTLTLSTLSARDIEVGNIDSDSRTASGPNSAPCWTHFGSTIGQCWAGFN